MKLDLLYIFENGKSSLKISTSYLFGLIKPEIQPFDNKKDNNNMKEKSKGLKQFNEYVELIDYIWERIIIERFEWKTNIGLLEPHYLSILYGFLWSIKGLIVSYLMSKKEIDYMKVDITPLYNTDAIAIRFNCIIKIRMVYIINIWIRIIKSNKGGEENGRPSNRRLDENYNE